MVGPPPTLAAQYSYLTKHTRRCRISVNARRHGVAARNARPRSHTQCETHLRVGLVMTLTYSVFVVSMLSLKPRPTRPWDCRVKSLSGKRVVKTSLIRITLRSVPPLTPLRLARLRLGDMPFQNETISVLNGPTGSRRSRSSNTQSKTDPGHCIDYSSTQRMCVSTHQPSIRVAIVYDERPDRALIRPTPDDGAD